MLLKVACELCSKNEYTKSESNSQPQSKEYNDIKNCVQRTNIQNLKAIHNTHDHPTLGCVDCVQRTNIQNLKAIHNIDADVIPYSDIVFKERIYKI